MVASGAGVAVMPSTAADPLMTGGTDGQGAAVSGANETDGRSGLARHFPRPQAIDAMRAAALSAARQEPSAEVSRWNALLRMVLPG